MITLAQAQNFTRDKLWLGVVDNLREDNLLEMMVFDNTAALSGGSTLNYVYNVMKVRSTAAFRAINSEYTASEASTDTKTVQLKILGGSYKIDRVIRKHVKGIEEQEAFQLREKIKAIKRGYAKCFIAGDTSTDDKQFDGVDKLMAANMKLDNNIDLSTAALITSNYTALTDAFRDMQAQMDGAPSAFFCSPEGYALIQKIADRAAGFTITKDNFGKETFYFNGTVFVPLGDVTGSEYNVIPTDAATGKTAFYPIRIGEDGVHGICPDDNSAGIAVYPINTAETSAVNEGGCEMVTAIAVKSTRAVGKISVKIKDVTSGGYSQTGGGNEDSETT